MTPLDAFRETLPPAYSDLSDDQLDALREQLGALARLVIEATDATKEKIK